MQIVYVVLVGGRAVPAAVAARDMRLVRDAEVARELGAVVTTKAEREYLAVIVNILIFTMNENYKNKNNNKIKVRAL